MRLCVKMFSSTFLALLVVYSIQSSNSSPWLMCFLYRSRMRCCCLGHIHRLCCLFHAHLHSFRHFGCLFHLNLVRVSFVFSLCLNDETKHSNITLCHSLHMTIYCFGLCHATLHQVTQRDTAHHDTSQHNNKNQTKTI